MNEHATARHYGRLIGFLSGLFALMQVMVSASALKENQLTVQGLQHALAVGSGGLNLLQDLVPVLVITYLSAAIAGAIMLGFAWYAGRLTALAIGRRQFGAAAGFWVALWCGTIWLALSAIVTLLAHADGTITGIFTASPDGSNLGAEVILLLVQNTFAALCGLGFGALAGLIGAAGAPVPPAGAVARSIQPGYPAGYVTGYRVVYPPAGPATPWPGNYPQRAYPSAAYPPGTPRPAAPGGAAPSGREGAPQDPVGRT